MISVSQSIISQGNQENDIFKDTHQLIESDAQIQNDKVDLLSPWTITKYPLRNNKNQINNGQKQQNKHYYSIQIPSLQNKSLYKKQDPKVSFRLTFNSLRTRKTHRQYASLDAQLKQQKNDIQMIKARRQLIKGPKLLCLDVSCEQKKTKKKHNQKMHKFDPQNQKVIQLNPYHRNRRRNKQIDKITHLNPKKQKFLHEQLNSKQVEQKINSLHKLKIISFDEVIKNSQENCLKTGCKERQGPLLKNYKMQRIIKSERLANNSFYNVYNSKTDQFLYCGDLINSSTLHSSNRQRLRKIGAVREYLNNREQEQLNNYLNKTMFVG